MFSNAAELGFTSTGPELPVQLLGLLGCISCTHLRTLRADPVELVHVCAVLSAAVNAEDR